MIRTLLALLALTLGASLPAAGQTPSVTVTEGSGRVLRLPQEAASVFVGDPGVADVQAVSPQGLYLSGIAPGETNVLALDFDDQLIAAYRVFVTANNTGATALLREGDSDIAIRQSGNTAILRGTADTMDEALSALDARRSLEAGGRFAVDRSTLAGGTQISLRVRFVEASRRDLFRLGFDLSAIGNGGDPLRILTGAGIASDFLARDVGLGGYGGRAGIGGDVGGATVDGVISALEREGIVQILSEPTLTTTSGVRANFSAGGEFAFPVNQGDGVIAAEYKAYGVSIDFLPTLLPNGRIALQVSPEVSFIDPDIGVSVQGFQAPSLSVRRAETTVEVGSGQTFAIAGLYEQFGSDTESGLPGMRRAGPFRSLFGTVSRRRDERELVIFITPYLAEASDAVAENRTPATRVVDRVGFIVD